MDTCALMLHTTYTSPHDRSQHVALLDRPRRPKARRVCRAEVRARRVEEHQDEGGGEEPARGVHREGETIGERTRAQVSAARGEIHVRLRDSTPVSTHTHTRGHVRAGRAHPQSHVTGFDDTLKVQTTSRLAGSTASFAAATGPTRHS